MRSVWPAAARCARDSRNEGPSGTGARGAQGPGAAMGKKTGMSGQRIVVVGAGIVGMSAALALAERGHAVTLIDRGAPGAETSTWNAGVLATSSLVPICNPGIYRKLPGYLAGTSPGFSLNWAAAPGLAGWGLRSLRAARPAVFGGTAAALNALIGYSRGCHAARLQEAGLSGELVENGWLHLYWSPALFGRARAGLGLYHDHGVAAEALAGTEVTEMEPALRRTPAGAIFFPGTAAVRDPRHVIAAYLRLLAGRGVELRRAEVRGLTPRSGGGVDVATASGALHADRAVVAAGAWSRALLAGQARLPLAVERGYLMRYGLETSQVLRRPLFDTENGFVLSPRPGGVQLSTGTDLTRLAAPPRPRQFTRAEVAARALVALGARQFEAPAVGNRPSTPDALPILGPLARARDIWVATGHQHVGFSTGPGSGQVLADLMSGRRPQIDPAPFAPARFGL